MLGDKIKVCFKKLFIFREIGEGREKERETSMCQRDINQLPLARPLLGTWPATQACALTGNPTGDSLVCRPVLNPLSLTSQGKIKVSLILLNIDRLLVK